MNTTELLDGYRRAQDGFDEVVSQVPADGWDGPSACAKWTNRDVIGHVVWGQELVRHLATGVPYESRTGAPGAPNPGVLVPGDPVPAWRAARASSVPTLTEESLRRPMPGGVFTDAPLSGFIRALIADFMAHAWDIGSAAGLDVKLDASLLPDSWAWARETITFRDPDFIGPEVAPAAGADEQTRYLAYLGRPSAVAG
ncbi:maleylpyruvate isomerase family mycothiol-dependent enzyme [Pseudonocardia acaciae]|uniref:maleylpyruvate isomerase family mycothiol-dependent enzyme n=1 Tax=Pseudonocardia acaciae TaxID=551276 RepID=UPI0004920A5C|nr:maleylpyruvate isomerase family mycothiol-dependent enzyme [Pseudonocardia acaciae]